MDIQQHGHQGAGAGHLRDEVEKRDEEGGDRRRHAHGLLLQAEGQDVRHGKAADVTHGLGNEHECYQPGNEEAHRVQEAVVAIECHRADDA